MSVLLKLKKASLAVIVGPNGAGKSTVMRVLLGMLEATCRVQSYLDGKDISMLSTQERITQGFGVCTANKKCFSINDS